MQTVCTLLLTGQNIYIYFRELNAKKKEKQRPFIIAPHNVLFWQWFRILCFLSVVIFRGSVHAENVRILNGTTYIFMLRSVVVPLCNCSKNRSTGVVLFFFFIEKCVPNKLKMNTLLVYTF